MCRRLKALRDNAGYTQSIVADYLCVSQAAYSRLEKGETEISLSKMLQLADLYRTSVARLLENI